MNEDIGLSKRYGKKLAVDDLSLTVQREQNGRLLACLPATASRVVSTDDGGLQVRARSQPRNRPDRPRRAGQPRAHPHQATRWSPRA